MKPVLLDYPVISLQAMLFLLLAIGLLIALWWAFLYYRQQFTRDHLFNGLLIAGMSCVMLFIVYKMGHFRVNAYGAMLIIGFFVGIISAVQLGKRRGIPAQKIYDLAIIILLAAIIGARLLYLLITDDAGPFFDLNEVLQSGLGGLSFHGGLIAGLLTAIIYCWRTKISFWRLADTMAPSVAIGYAITRIGCFLNGCCYGRHTDIPWAVSFPANSASGSVNHVHPTQLYASFIMFVAFLLLLWLARGDSLRRAGRIFMVYLMLAGLERVVMEIFRQPDPNYSSLITPAQWFSLAIILVGVAGWFYLPPVSAIPGHYNNKIVTKSKVKKISPAN